MVLPWELTTTTRALDLFGFTRSKLFETKTVLETHSKRIVGVDYWALSITPLIFIIGTNGLRRSL